VREQQQMLSLRRDDRDVAAVAWPDAADLISALVTAFDQDGGLEACRAAGCDEAARGTDRGKNGASSRLFESAMAPATTGVQGLRLVPLRFLASTKNSANMIFAAFPYQRQ
jgi:hypothetical protein